MAAARSLRVLYLHGLESGPNGRKAVLLRNQFGVDNVATPCVGVNVRRLAWDSIRHRPVKWSTWAAMTCALLASGTWPALASAASWLPAAAAVVVKLAVVAAGARLLPLAALRREVVDTLEDRLAVAADAVQRFNPDVVVGSSWGGCLAVFLLHRGVWHGRTVVLAPAHAKAARLAGVPVPTIPATARCTVHVVHSVADTVVPFQDSVALTSAAAAASPAASVSLLQVHGDSHALRSVCSGEGRQLLFARIGSDAVVGGSRSGEAEGQRCDGAVANDATVVPALHTWWAPRAFWSPGTVKNATPPLS